MTYVFWCITHMPSSFLSSSLHLNTNSVDEPLGLLTNSSISKLVRQIMTLALLLLPGKLAFFALAASDAFCAQGDTSSTHSLFLLSSPHAACLGLAPGRQPTAKGKPLFHPPWELASVEWSYLVLAPV